MGREMGRGNYIWELIRNEMSLKSRIACHFRYDLRGPANVGDVNEEDTGAGHGGGRSRL